MEAAQSLQPPYQLLRDLFERAEVVPFLGAGASLDEEAGGITVAPTAIPSGSELAHYLAELACLPREEIDRADLLEVASCFQLMADRGELHKRLKAIFNKQQRPGPIHYFLADLPGPLLIVTTNYDSLIERAFSERGRGFHVLMTPTDVSDSTGCVLWWEPGAMEPRLEEVNKFLPSHRDSPIIYKIHGGLDPAGQWYGCVITEDDYFDIGGRLYEGKLLPYWIQVKLRRSTLLFLGYSLRDLHVRELVRRLMRSTEVPGPSHYLVSKKFTALDRLRFHYLGLNCYELSIAGFLEGLQRIGQDPTDA